MKHIVNKYIERFDDELAKEHTHHELILENCVIKCLDVNSLEFHDRVCIRNCVIHELIVYGSWFSGGLLFKNNVVLAPINYEMGGHNQMAVTIAGNVFHGFISFFDCHFKEKLTVANNIFMQGTDLLAKENKGFDNLFDGGIILDNNIGKLDILEIK